MIRVDPAFAAAVYLGVAVGGFLLLWFLDGREDEEGAASSDEIERCPYCGHVFSVPGGQASRRCPECLSYLETPGEPHDDAR